MAGTICDSATRYLAALGELLHRVDALAIDRFAELLYQVRRDQRRAFFFGNGGSASTASHHACDLVKTAAVDGQRRLEVMSLCDNMGLLTALGNDVGYDDVFVYPLSTYARKGDLAVAISCSGNSPNVLRGCQWARENGLKVVALTGMAGGKLKDLADLHINIPSDNFGIIEDMHLAVGHMAAQILKSKVLADCAVGCGL